MTDNARIDCCLVSKFCSVVTKSDWALAGVFDIGVRARTKALCALQMQQAASKGHWCNLLFISENCCEASEVIRHAVLFENTESRLFVQSCHVWISVIDDVKALQDNLFPCLYFSEIAYSNNNLHSETESRPLWKWTADSNGFMVVSIVKVFKSSQISVTHIFATLCTILV